jgi:hypothetical protein
LLGAPPELGELAPPDELAFPLLAPPRPVSVPPLGTGPTPALERTPPVADFPADPPAAGIEALPATALAPPCTALDDPVSPQATAWGSIKASKHPTPVEQRMHSPYAVGSDIATVQLHAALARRVERREERSRDRTRATTMTQSVAGRDARRSCPSNERIFPVQPIENAHLSRSPHDEKNHIE